MSDNENGATESSYFIQPMTGMVHNDPDCSVGTARYGTVRACTTDAEVEEAVRTGRSKSCKKCGPQL